MQRFVRNQIVAIMATLTLVSACNNSKTDSEPTSDVKSDWSTEATPGGVRTYAIDWACEPKQYGSSAETKPAYQDEYCEWKTVRTTATEKQCRFTVSFDKSRDFFLNSRGKTPFNTISAARQIVRDCNGIALSRLKKGQTAGKLCSGITSGCVAGRNSDPEICDKTRWAVGEKYKGNIEFCVDQLAPSDFVSTPRPLMQFGVLADIPENCQYSDNTKTELLCTIPAEDDCFSIAGQIRVGLRVITKAASTDNELSSAAGESLPAARECFTP
ncbi:MAG: hypothetical protein EOP10_01110 [Proteobacteria bacterium]|nr:MAG: hypothetical protein EOP10_01110 [Pseudomonadota bacterium]